MNKTLVVTVIGADKPGLVGLLSETAASHGANWESSRMAHMAGRFAGIVVLSVEEQKAEALQASLLGLEGLDAVIKASKPEPDHGAWRKLTLDLVGNDHPGILRDISNALAKEGVNVEELETEVVSAPMSGEPLFKLQAELIAPPKLSTETLTALLEDLAGDLMVEVRLESA